MLLSRYGGAVSIIPKNKFLPGRFVSTFMLSRYGGAVSIIPKNKFLPGRFVSTFMLSRYGGAVSIIPKNKFLPGRFVSTFMLSRYGGAVSIIPKNKFLPGRFVSTFMLSRYGGAVSIIPKNKFLPGRFVSTFMLSKVLSNTNTNTNTIPYDDSGSRVIHPDQVSNNYISAVTLFENNLSYGYASISYYNTILSSLLRMGYSSSVLSLAQQLEESHNNHLQRVLPDVHTWTILIKAHAFSGNMSSAMSLFHKIINNGHRPTTEETLNILLHGFCCRCQIHKAMLFYNYIMLKNENGCFKWNHHSYLILITELCEIGETQSAIQLLRKALQIEIDTESLDGITVMRCYNTIIFRLACKDRLINQAYDLYSEMKLHGNNVSPSSDTYRHLIFGYCIIGQFKQAIRLFKEFKASKNIRPCLHTLAVTEREVKSAKSVVAVMIKGGLRPNVASYHSVIDRLYKGQSRRKVMNKIAQKVDTLVRPKFFPADGYYDYM